MIYNDELMAMRFRNELEKIKRGDLPKTAFTISISDWNLTDGKYLAVISASDLTADKYVEVFFDDSCSVIVSAAKISTEGETFEGGISITAENLPTDTISGSYYIFKGDSFMSKARVNTGSYQETVFVGATSITSGVAGNVPAPLAGDQNKFLCGNGQWATIPSGGSGGGDLVINGDEVQEVTLTGADYSYDSGTKKASVAIPTAMQEVSVIGGALQASIDGSKLFLLGSNATVQKASANFSLSADNVTLNAYEPVTISASRLGNGLIKCYDNATYFDINQLSATEFRFLGRKVATVNAGFWLDETADYYGAAKNVNITVTQGASDILMHFDDAAEPFLNEGTANANIVEGGKLKKTWQVSYDEMATELSSWPGLDELRIVKGTCIYVEDFTPPTEPF